MAIGLKFQIEFLIPYNNASSFNDEKNAPFLAQNVLDDHNCAGASELLHESVIVLLFFQDLAQ